MWVQEEGYCLRRLPQGEGRQRLSVFLRESGLVAVWARVSRRRCGAAVELPDLFEGGEYSLRRKRVEQAGWLEEYHPRRRFPGLSRSYIRVREASALAGFVEANLPHMEDFGEAWRIYEQAMAALERVAVLEVVLFKAVFALSRSEGYAVSREWLAGQPSEEAEAMRESLRLPAEECPASGEEVERWRRRLFRYVATSTELIPPREAG